MKRRRLDLIVFPLVLLIGILFGSWQVSTMPGVPAHGRYHPSDMDDLQEQLLGHSVLPKFYSAASDHPAWLGICSLYQKTSEATGLQEMELWNLAMPLLVGVNLGLFFALARQLRFNCTQALALTAVLLSTGATMTWSVVLETHVLAPTSLLIAALIVSNRRLTSRLWGRPTPFAIATYGLALAIAASITITNMMLAILAVVPGNLFRTPSPARFVRRTLQRLPTLVVSGLVATGLLAFVHVATWYAIQDREMRQFLEILGERHLIEHMAGSWWETILSLAWIAPPMDAYHGNPEEIEMLALKRNWTTAPAYVSGLIVFVLTLCSLRVMSPRTLFLPGFVLFGVVLHSIYGLGESFLYAANYTWASLISIGLLGRAVMPRQLTWVALALAVALFIVNILIWQYGVNWIIENNYILPSSLDPPAQ